jgi:arylsulfatase A-like enzyme
MGDAENVVGDQSFGLVFIHLPVPHPPAIYNRASGNFAMQKNGYLDNLALADRVVGELRQKMEQAGVWEHTTLIVSSDHWWRSDYWRKRVFWSGADEAIAGVVDHRIPFIVKLAGQTTAAQYDAAFNTVLTHDLILEVLRGGISNQGDLAGWLDKHRTIGESPYQSYEDE